VSDKFQNGLLLTAPAASQCGRTFCRWLFEWATVILGQTNVDNSDVGKWTSCVFTDTSGSYVTSYEDRFSIGASAYNFDSVNDKGAYLTLTNMSAHNGIYRILRVIDTKTVALDIKYSVHEDGLPQSTGINWRLWRPTATYVPTNTDFAVLGGLGTIGAGYTYHLHMLCRNTNSYFPEFVIGPWANWDPAGNVWLDAKHTTARGIDNYSNSVVNVDNCRVWAIGDTDRIIVMIRTEDDNYSWHFVYLGEIDTYYPSIDTKPCVVWAGSNAGVATPQDASDLIGVGGANSINGGGRWLAADNVTTVNGYLMFSHCSPCADAHWLALTYRRWSQYNFDVPRMPLICESRTAGNMELRGSLRRIWATSRDLARLSLLGLHAEYLHLVGGFVVPWNVSRVWYSRS